MAELAGKIAVITGAGSGMGRAACEQFIAHGAKVIAADISGRQNDTAATIGRDCIAVHCDVTQEGDVAAMMQAALTAHGRIDAVLNVAGFGLPALLGDLDMSEYDRVLDADLRGVIHGTKHGIAAMTPTGGGLILNWASVAAFGATPNWGVYAAAKAGIIAITRSTAIEYGHAGIRANVICPGTVLTEAMAKVPADRAAAMLAKVPLGRLGQPKEVAEFAVFLTSDRAHYINGAVLTIDGGQTARLP